MVSRRADILYYRNERGRNAAHLCPARTSFPRIRSIARSGTVFHSAGCGPEVVTPVDRLTRTQWPRSAMRATRAAAVSGFRP